MKACFFMLFLHVVLLNLFPEHSLHPNELCTCVAHWMGELICNQGQSSTMQAKYLTAEVAQYNQDVGAFCWKIIFLILATVWQKCIYHLTCIVYIYLFIYTNKLFFVSKEWLISSHPSLRSRRRSSLTLLRGLWLQERESWLQMNQQVRVSLTGHRWTSVFVHK